jgi:predicted nucleotide-binding protein
MVDVTSLIEAANALKSAAAEYSKASFQNDLLRLKESAEQAGRAWSGSNAGYHANVYYSGLQRPPQGAVFSMQSGLRDALYSDTVGDWREYQSDGVKAEIFQRARVANLDDAEEAASALNEQTQALKHDLLSVLSVALSSRDDGYLADQKRLLDDVRTFTVQTALHAQIPERAFLTNDMRALNGGTRGAPHQMVLAELIILGLAGTQANDVAQIAQRVGAHLERSRSAKRGSTQNGNRVFIGHGRSKLWRELKDFLQDRLGLPWDEFNRVPVAGVANVMRLNEMLDSAGMAFLLLTAEDEQRDGRLQARMNVIHEVGLFQGRLGFSRAIVLLEEGCEEFSNIQGLGQIRFPAGNIAAAFEDVRLVLEREGLVAE